MSQLSLNIPGRLVYSSKGFCLHSGVRDLFAKSQALLTQNRFSLCFIYGAARSGKTHCAVALEDALASQGASVFTVDGPDLSNWISERIARTALRGTEVILVDDAHLYLEAILPGQSGEFVNLVEAARRGKAKIVLFSSKELAQFGFDDHVRSRIVPGDGLRIGAPVEEELAEIFGLMAKQRGMIFSARKLEYWLKRIGRDIAAIDRCLSAMDGMPEPGEDVEAPDIQPLDDIVVSE